MYLLLWQVTSQSDHFMPQRNAPETICIGGWVGFRPSLNARAKMRMPFPARNQNIHVQPVTSTETSQLRALVIHTSVSNDNHIRLPLNVCRMFSPIRTQEAKPRICFYPSAYNKRGRICTWWRSTGQVILGGHELSRAGYSAALGDRLR